jgi:hypothetical protein
MEGKHREISIIGSRRSRRDGPRNFIFNEEVTMKLLAVRVGEAHHSALICGAGGCAGVYRYSMFCPGKERGREPAPLVAGVTGPNQVEPLPRAATACRSLALAL